MPIPWREVPCQYVRTGLPWYSCTRKSVAASMPGSGRNHTSRPALSTIIGPFCFWSFFCLALRKTKPGAVAWRPGETVTSGGSRSGRERKWCVAPALMFSRIRLGIWTRPGTRMMRNRKSPLLALRTVRPVLTVTVSPERKRFDGTQLAPSPSECARMRPVCVPEREPRTTIRPRLPGATPRNESCVVGDALSVPGCG